MALTFSTLDSLDKKVKKKDSILIKKMIDIKLLENNENYDGSWSVLVGTCSFHVVILIHQKPLSPLKRQPL